MLARDLMSSPATTVGPDASCSDALRLLEEHRCRRLPVVDRKGCLIGIVSVHDLPGSIPSLLVPLTTFERRYLLDTVSVRRVMKKRVITAAPDTLIEHAAQLMLVNQVSGLPVVDEQNCVVGVITETDLVKAFVEMLPTEKSEV